MLVLRPRHPFRAGVLLAAAALVVTGLAVAGPSSAAPVPTLAVTPGTFVGGQMVTYSGNVGARDVVVRLQGSQRPGAPWTTFATRRSDARGDYRFTLPAPSMQGIQRRVVAAGTASRVIRMWPRAQDLVVVPVGTPVAGDPFELEVSTTPGPHWGPGHPYYVKGRKDLPPPVFEGRELTLQQRVSRSAWRDVPGGTATTDGSGKASFSVTPSSAGTFVYRVVQEEYPQPGGPPIGWFPSFPTPVSVAASRAAVTTYPRPAPAPRATPATAAASTTSSAATAEGPRHGFNTATAAAARGWGLPLWDFGYYSGESLTDPPSRGSSLRGWWQDASDGTGRANQHNGGVSLDSQRNAPANRAEANRGDRGSTWITLHGQPRRYGRWEVEVRARSFEDAARDYRVHVELVPDRPGQYRCGGQNIMVGDLAAHARTIQFGAKSVQARRQWRGRHRVGDINNYPVSVAVEATKRHLTWFYNGRPVGTVRSRAAVPRVPMTMRITLQGRGTAEMNRTVAHFDWMRGYSLRRGHPTSRGGVVPARRYTGGC